MTSRDKSCRLHVFKDSNREWRWSLRAANGRGVAYCGEGYKNRKHAVAISALLFPWVDPVTRRGVIPARRGL